MNFNETQIITSLIGMAGLGITFFTLLTGFRYKGI